MTQGKAICQGVMDHWHNRWDGAACRILPTGRFSQPAARVFQQVTSIK